MSDAKPGNEHEPRTHQIVVNGKRKTVEVNEVTYDQILHLAYETPDVDPNVRYTITWARSEHGEATGILTPESKPVKVNEGMVFNVKRTDKS